MAEVKPEFRSLVEGFSKTKKILGIYDDYSENGDYTIDKEGEIIGFFARRDFNVDFELLSKCTKLKSLGLTDFGFEEIPNFVFSFKNLEFLNLQSNQINSIPDEIYKIKKLRGLRLDDNLIEYISPEFCKLNKLINLDLDGNRVEVLPDRFGDLEGVQDLFLDNNRIVTLPDSIAGMKNLKNVSLASNQITTLNFETVSFNLSELDISDNLLKRVPEFIKGLFDIETLNLSENNIESIPSWVSDFDKLNWLDIDWNMIETIPESMVGLVGKLSYLFFRGNPIPIPDPSFHDFSASQKIQTLLEIQKSELQPINQTKVLVVGDERVGKSSLINRLKGNKHNPNQTTTQGIEISEISLKDYKCNLWDFAGQELTHQTHQFFLSERSLYLFVVDAQKEDNRARDRHWLNTIKSLGHDSPIIVVVNYCDKNLNYKFDKNLYADEFNIVDVVYTSACDMDKLDEKITDSIGDSILNLQDQICSTIPSVPGIDRKLPKTWHAVKDGLDNLKQTENVISREQYDEICEDIGIPGAQARNTLLKILNSIGTVVAYPEDLRLKLTQILKPEWVTDAVYKIVRSNPDSNGVYSEQTIADVLGSNYTTEQQRWLIDLIIKFELGFRVQDNGDILVPMRLNTNMPDFARAQYQSGLNIRFNYHKRGLLKTNVMAQLIVRMHLYVDADSPKYWRYGVFLKNQDCRAVVIADDDNQCIDVLLTKRDENAKMLLDWVRSNLEKIEETQYSASGKTSLPYQEEVAVFDDSCTKRIGHVTYKKLQRAFDNRRDTIEVEIVDPETGDEDDKDYNVHELLGLYGHVRVRAFEKKSFTRDLIRNLLSLTESRASIVAEIEDLINDRLRGLLKANSYQVMDQSRGGFSESHKGPGERDFVINDKYGEQVSLMEALILKDMTAKGKLAAKSKRTLASHYQKLTQEYNTHGNPVDFLVTYAKVENFSDLWTGYLNEFEDIHDITKTYTDKAVIKVALTREAIDDTDAFREIVHVVVNFGVQPKQTTPDYAPTPLITAYK